MGADWVRPCRRLRLLAIAKMTLSSNGTRTQRPNLAVRQTDSAPAYAPPGYLLIVQKTPRRCVSPNALASG